LIQGKCALKGWLALEMRAAAKTYLSDRSRIDDRDLAKG